MPTAARLRWARMRVSAVAFVALLVLGVLLALLTGGTLSTAYTRIYVFMPDAGGLYTKAHVRLNGIPIGTVEDVRFSRLKDPNRTIVAQLKIDSQYIPEIPVDSMASLTAENVIGDKYLDISKGRSRIAVRAGGSVPFTPEVDVMKRLDLTEFEARLRTIDALLADIQSGKSTVGEFFVGEQLYRDTVKGIVDLEKAIDEATSSQRAFGRLLYSADTFARIMDTVHRVDERLAALQRGEGAGRYARDSAQYDDMLASMARVRRSIGDLNAGKGRWGEFLTNDAAYTRWVRSLDGLIRGIEDFNTGEGRMGPYFVNAQVFESLTGTSRELATTLKEFREDPRKFVRIAIF